MPINYDEARLLLQDVFATAQTALADNVAPPVTQDVDTASDQLFRSSTQAYREALLGCTVARIQDKTLDVRLPYIRHGRHSFNGRTLDEKVINPFLHDKRIPCSRGPYLSVFRRSVRFDGSTRDGLRDKPGYDAFLKLLSHLQAETEQDQLVGFLRHLLYKFAVLREGSTVALSKLPRLSLDQFDALIPALLEPPSGGRFPVLLIVATFTAFNEALGLGWRIASQGINVADAPSGGAGDVTVSDSHGTILLAAEVTERPLDRPRLVSTFGSKISLHGVKDYLFFVKSPNLDPSVSTQIHDYFSQGYEVGVLDMKTWILMSLATIGERGRAVFLKAIAELLEKPDVPKAMKVTWNEHTAHLSQKT